MPVLFLLITLLTPLSEQGPASHRKDAIPDYFGNQNSGRPALKQCSLSSQGMAGRFKTCRYDCGASLTVGERATCPFVLQR
ncbi:hypothetical protein [Ensifer soli]|uniref:hypothetical protein n=1 Tax=Ciceribacter sp. sgz301302 TaxID=3342379 RepID=UPI0035B9621F